jgi:hypothetical protein
MVVTGAQEKQQFSQYRSVRPAIRLAMHSKKHDGPLWILRRFYALQGTDSSARAAIGNAASCRMLPLPHAGGLSC